MAREGGYGKSTKAEWIKTDRKSYGDAITSSAAMGQDLETWTADALAHHVYRCEMILGRQRYAEACKDAADRLKPTPLESDYMPTRTPPTITRPAGKASGPGKEYSR